MVSDKGYVDRADLLAWADTTVARYELPLLLRRLILETGVGITRLGFDGEEGADIGGWDGTVDATESTPYIPEGKSLWELSVRKDEKPKADEDYGKRLSAPGGANTGDCTYIAAILRSWSKRESWAEDKSKDGRWKDVRAYGVDDISTWLGTAPITHTWISERLGFHPLGVIPSEFWWERWANATNPSLPPSFVLAGREKQVEALRSQVNGQPQIITISGSSEEEVRAFICAFLVAESDNDGGRLMARAAIVDNTEAWRRLQLENQRLVLVVGDDNVKAEASSDSSHFALIPVSGVDNADIVLGRIDTQRASDSLKSAGLDEKTSDETASIARNSLLSARRHLAVKKELHQPEWAVPPVPRNTQGC